MKTFVTSISYRDPKTLAVKQASYRIMVRKEKGWCVIKCPDFGIVSIGYTFPAAIKNLKTALDIYSSKSNAPNKNRKPLSFNAQPFTTKNTTHAF